jgi:hypothetical protein
MFLSNLSILSVPDEGFSNLLILSVPDEGFSNLLILSVPDNALFEYKADTISSR